MGQTIFNSAGHRIILSVQHLDENQKIDAGYGHDTADPEKLAREIIMDLGPTPSEESGLFGGVFFSRIDFNLTPRGGFKDTFHVHWENGKLMVGVQEVTDEFLECDGVRVSLDHSPGRRK
jgi:hypothetical protein